MHCQPDDATLCQSETPTQAQESRGFATSLVTIAGPDLGRRHLLDRPSITIGRGRDAEIHLPLAGVSRHHCRIERRRDAFVIHDLGSTNGTFLNDEGLLPDVDTILRAGDIVRVASAVYKFLRCADAEAAYHEALYRAIATDSLTEALSRRALMERLDREIAACTYAGRTLSVVMFDIDGFKQVNDEHGHAVGDALLRELTGLVREHLVGDGALGRFGGDEFVVILPAAALDEARRMAESLRVTVSNHRFARAGGVRTSLSLGVAQFRPGMDSFDSLLERVDARLYAAKRAGRDRVAA